MAAAAVICFCEGSGAPIESLIANLVTHEELKTIVVPLRASTRQLRAEALASYLGIIVSKLKTWSLR